MPYRRDLRNRAAVLAIAVALALLAGGVAACSAAATSDVTPPAAPVRLVFIHHSTGQAWLEDGHGGLGPALRDNNYFVSDTNYGWGPDGIGDRTDIGDWWTWFRGPDANTYTGELYPLSGQNCSYSRMAPPSPSGENTVIMFKSCFPNSDVGGNPADAVPPIASNPLKGSGMNNLTVGNAKGVYLDLLEYFRTQPDKLFVLVVSPPLKSDATTAQHAANARALANWLVDPNGYLQGYSAGNVFVFDYYTVLTGGHHRVVAGAVEHTAGPNDYLAFPTGDSHPSAEGDRVATDEFVPMLNAAYNSWRAGTGAAIPPGTTVSARAGALSRPWAGRSRLSRRRTYTWRGSVAPAQSGSSIVRLHVYRKSGRKWRRYGVYSATIADGAGTWSRRLRLRRSGSYRVRAYHADGDHLASTSSYRYVSVR